MKKVQPKSEYNLVGKDGKVVKVKTLTDFKEYVASGYYTPANGEQEQVIEDAEFTEVDEPDQKEEKQDLSAVASAFKELRNKDKALEDMTKEELRAKYEEVFGKKPAGAISEAKMIKEIEAA